MSNRKDLWRNIIAQAGHSEQRQLIAKGLEGLALSEESRVLSLASFFEDRPQKFFDHKAYGKFFHTLGNVSARHPASLASYFSAHEPDLSRAFFFLHEINSLPWYDDIGADGEFQELRFIDQELHPAYLRLLEAVLFPFLHLIAFFSRIDRGKPTTGLDLFNAIEEVSRSAIPEVAFRYNNTMRNGIAHGGITFGLREVEYRDKKGTLVLDVREVVRAFDDLLDFSNGLALALGAFLLAQSEVRYQIPQQLLINELRAETLSLGGQLRVASLHVSQRGASSLFMPGQLPETSIRLNSTAILLPSSLRSLPLALTGTSCRFGRLRRLMGLRPSMATG
jgi:hypothetical protein